MHIFKARQPWVKRGGVWRETSVPVSLGCPAWSKTFLQGHSWNIFPAWRSLTKFHLHFFMSEPPFLLFVALVPLFNLLLLSLHLQLRFQLSSSPTADDQRGGHFSFSCIELLYFPLGFCFIPPFRTQFVDMTARNLYHQSPIVHQHDVRSL